jgi:hypothetical protein
MPEVRIPSAIPKQCVRVCSVDCYRQIYNIYIYLEGYISTSLQPQMLIVVSFQFLASKKLFLCEKSFYLILFLKSQCLIIYLKKRLLDLVIQQKSVFIEVVTLS